MKDMYGKEIKNGDILVEGDNWGEVALFFKVIENKPVLIARWGTGVLDKYTTDKLRKHSENLKERMESGEKFPEWLIQHYKDSANRLENVDSEELMLVEGINVEIINKFLDEGHEAIDYGCTYPETIPIAVFPDKEIIGGH